MSFNSNEVAKLWFLYIEDENPVIRSNIAAAIKRLLLNKISIVSKFTLIIEDDIPVCLNEFVEALINTIAQTLIKVLTNTDHALHDTLLITAKNCGWYNEYLKIFILFDINLIIS